jgi:hypothetical protein
MRKGRRGREEEDKSRKERPGPWRKYIREGKSAAG